MQEDHITFSIIIAAWNAESTIRIAIESITSQLKRNYEILIVDDDSKDNTFELISTLAKRNSRIKIFKNKKNLGPSESRNLGISKIRGEYVGFLDADDCYSEGLFSLLLEEIKRTKPDVIKFGVKEEYSDCERIVSSPSFLTINKKEIIRQSIHLETLPLFGYAANSFYRTNLLLEKDIQFIKDMRFSEDFFFNLALFQHVRIFTFIDFIGYYYNKKSCNSLSSKEVPNYSSLYQKKITLLTSWAESNNCLSSCGSDLYQILMKTIYSSAVRGIEQKRAKSTIHNIRRLMQSREFNLLSPFFKRRGSPLSRKVANIPLVIGSPILVFLLSFVLTALKKRAPKTMKKL